MKSIFFSIALMMFIPLFSEAQNAMKSPVMNHITVFVVDLDKSASFYQNVMQLEKIAEPFKDGRHVWFKIGEHSQLHVVSGAKDTVHHDINIHLAFTVASLDDFMKHLDKYNVQYGNWKRDSKAPQLRPDGIKQIYFQDPEGYWIEVNDDKF